MNKGKNYEVAEPSESRTWMKEEDLMTICTAWEDFSGPTDVAESAIGALIVGRLIGYDGLRVIHSWKTLRKYEEILKISFKETLPARTPDSRRITGIRLADKFQAFWKAIAGGVSSEPNAKVVSA